MELRVASPPERCELPSPEDLAAWARTALRHFDAQMHPQGQELNELRATGVASHTIEALYPFDRSLYNVGILDLLADLEVQREQSRAWQRARPGGTFLTALPPHLQQRYLLYALSGDTVLAPEDLPHYGRDAWASDFYLDLLLHGLYEYPAILRVLSKPLPEESLAQVDPAELDRLRRVADVLTLRLIELAAAH